MASEGFSIELSKTPGGDLKRSPPTVTRAGHEKNGGPVAFLRGAEIRARKLMTRIRRQNIQHYQNPERGIELVVPSELWQLADAGP